MSTTCRVFIATSLDGFIARPDGSIDWLEEANRLVPPGEDCGYAAFMSTVDAMVMGRVTFDLARSFDSWPYGQTPVYVLSNTLSELPPGTSPTVRLLRAQPQDVIFQAAREGQHSLYVDGGQTIQSFLATGLISEMIITVIPVLIGSGRPLFGQLTADVRLRHIGTRSFPFGFVQNHYAVISDA